MDEKYMDTYEGEKDKRDICYGIINYIKRSNGRDDEFKNTKLLCEMIAKLSFPQSIIDFQESKPHNKGCSFAEHPLLNFNCYQKWHPKARRPKYL